MQTLPRAPTKPPPCCPPSLPPARRGYTACHVAAQYAQTATLYRLALKWNADIDSPDGDGRTPLHWAAYKGAADSVRLLLVLGARSALPDREGCTPLHWAAIRGNSEAATALLQARVRCVGAQRCAWPTRTRRALAPAACSALALWKLRRCPADPQHVPLALLRRAAPLRPWTCQTVPVQCPRSWP